MCAAARVASRSPLPVFGRAAEIVWISMARIFLTDANQLFKLADMEVHLKPETVSRLNELASQCGRSTDDLVEDAMAAYLGEVTDVRKTLDGRYDDIESGRVKPIDGEAFFENLRQREDELLKRRPPK
jgi:predicted DNA-binding protein